MKLSRFNLNAGAADEVYPYMYTTAEAMFPNMGFAIVGVDPEHTGDEAGVVRRPKRVLDNTDLKPVSSGKQKVHHT
jgi:hypothetical protein